MTGVCRQQAALPSVQLSDNHDNGDDDDDQAVSVVSTKRLAGRGSEGRRASE